MAINIYKTGHPSVTRSFQEYFITLAVTLYIGFIAHPVFTFLFDIASCITRPISALGRSVEASIDSIAGETSPVIPLRCFV